MIWLVEDRVIETFEGFSRLEVGCTNCVEKYLALLVIRIKRISHYLRSLYGIQDKV